MCLRLLSVMRKDIYNIKFFHKVKKLCKKCVTSGLGEASLSQWGKLPTNGVIAEPNSASGEIIGSTVIFMSNLIFSKFTENNQNYGTIKKLVKMKLEGRKF